MTHEETVRALWRAFDEGRFGDARPLLSGGFTADWPQTRELIRGPDNFIALNAAYPGRWRCRVESLLREGERVVSLVEISDPSHRLWATSWFEFEGGKIARAKEYFADAMEPPFDRGAWAERY